MYGLQPMDLVIILIVALIIFGPKRLPELAKAVGKSISEFKSAMNEGQQPADHAAANSPGENKATEVQKEG